MRTLSVQEQIALLRPSARYAAHIHYWLLAGAALCLIAALAFWHPVPLMIATFLGIVGFSEQRAGPNIVAALAAFDSDCPSTGEVRIAVSCWDTDQHYDATVCETGAVDWKFEFRPQGWQPTERTYPAQIWRAGTLGKPVLAIVVDGILIPRYDPKR